MEGESNVIITGPPRSGTTLVCQLLNLLDNVVALHEPMNLSMFAQPDNVSKMVDGFFKEMRMEISINKRALSKIKDGSIPTNPFNEGTVSRQTIVQKGYFKVNKPLTENFKLCIKHNAHFTFALEYLVNKYPVYVILRNPLSTIASWRSIEAPVSNGKVKVLYHLNPELAERLDLISDILERQVALLEMHYKAYTQWKDHIRFLRYEDIISSGGTALSIISKEAETLNQTLENKNSIKRYLADQLLERLNDIIKPDSILWAYYDKKEAFNEVL